MQEKNETETQKTFMLQLRVVRAFKSTIEDIEDRRSIHSLRSLRNVQNPAGQAGQSLHGLYLYQKHLKTANQPHGQSSNCDNFSITVPKIPLNLNDFNARYMDDENQPEDRTNTNGQSLETRI